VGPARIVTGSLTPDPELESSQGHEQSAKRNLVTAFPTGIGLNKGIEIKTILALRDGA
jgi:hypothetical protein